MKRKITVFAIMVCLSVTSFSQINFSVAKGNSLTTAKVGFKYKKFVPFIGLQNYSVSASVNASNQYYDINTLGLETETYIEDIKASAILPSIGVKYFFLEREKLKAFTSLSYTLPIFSIKTGDKGLNTEINNEIDKVNIWGSELGLGVEYFIDDQFSIGGEFGMRYIHFNYDSERDYIVIDQMTGEGLLAKSSESINLNIKPTFAKMSINFYF